MRAFDKHGSNYPMTAFISTWLPRSRGARVFTAILVGYALLFTWLACREFDACTIDTNNTSAFDCAYYMTLRGEFFWSYSSYASYFEAHAEPLMLLFVPVYYLVPGAKTLLFLETLCITVASIPVYLLGRKILRDEASGILMGIAFLFFPSVVAHNVMQFSSTAFPLPFLMFAFYFFQEEKFVPFLITAGLASLGKEMAPLTLIMFAPYALWKRRSWKWVAAPLAIPIAALSLSLGVIRPHFARSAQTQVEYPSLAYFSGFGNTPGEFIKTILSRPDKVFAALFTGPNAVYLLLLLTALGFVLPFFVAEVVFAFPELFFNLISNSDGLKTVVWCYNVNTGMFLVVATMYTLARVDRFLQSRLGIAKYGPVLAGCVALMCVSNWWQWFSPRNYVFPPQHEAQQAAFKLVPADDSLLVGPGQIVGHVCHRKVLASTFNFQLSRAKPEQMFLYNWVLFDMNYRVPQPGWSVPKEMFMPFVDNPQYELVFPRENVFARDNVFLFRRRQPFPPEQVPPIRIMALKAVKD
jgi:uncharacterized membrane protein